MSKTPDIFVVLDLSTEGLNPDTKDTNSHDVGAPLCPGGSSSPLFHLRQRTMPPLWTDILQTDEPPLRSHGSIRRDSPRRHLPSVHRQCQQFGIQPILLLGRGLFSNR